MNNQPLATIRTAIAALVSILIQLSQPALAVPIDINVIRSEVYNDRIGNSRFFLGPNTDRIRISAYVQPSPDSDYSGLSTNGASTQLSFTHSALGGVIQNMTYVGPQSPRGGGLNEYTYSVDRANSFIAARLNAFDASPFVITAVNPLAPTQTSLAFNAPDYDKNAMPGFVTAMRVTTGLTPTVEWNAPTSGAAPSNVQIQFRRIDAETPDRSRITAATLVQITNLSPTANSYTVPAGLLTQGVRYEISVQMDTRNSGVLQGRSRSFFEYTPLVNGAANVAVYLPSTNGNGQWKFDLPVAANQQIALDPIVAVGYDYEIGVGDPRFASVLLPNIGDGLFDLYLFDGSNWNLQTILAAGQQYFFGGNGVDRFRILGIETSAGIDPSDTTAFITTVSFTDSGRFTGTMTPITVDVPEPATLLLLAAGMAAFGIRRRVGVKASIGA